MENQQVVQNSNYYRDDEIDLGELLRKLFGQKILIIAITSIMTVLAVIYALMATPIYKVTTRVGLPTIEDVQSINSNGIENYSIENLYGQFFRVVTSNKLLRSYYDQVDMEKKLVKEGVVLSSDQKEQMFANFASALKVNQFVPSWVVVPKGEQAPLDQVDISIETSEKELMAEFLNGFIAFAGERTITLILEDQTANKKVQLDIIEKQIQGLTQTETAARETKIEQTIYDDKVKAGQLEDQIERLKSSYMANLLKKEAELKEALSIAMQLNITDPTTLEDLSPNAAQNQQIEVSTFLNSENNPMYLRGSKFISAELEHIKERKSDPSFISGLAELELKLKQVKNNRALAALRERKNDIVFASGVNALEKKAIDLNLASLDFTGAKVYETVFSAFPPQSPIKPNRKLIVAIGLVAGLFLGLFIALMAIALGNKKPELNKQD